MTVNRATINGSGGRPRVLFVAHVGGIAGAERALIDTVTFLRNTPFEPIVTVPTEGPLKQEIEALGTKVLVQPVKPWMPYKGRNKRHHLREYLEGLQDRVWQMVKTIEDENIALVHSNVNVILEGALASQLTGRPHVWHQHTTFRGNPDHSSWVPRALIPYILYLLSDVILCCSTFTAHELFHWHLRRKARVLYNGIDVEKLTPGRPQHDLRVELALSRETPLVGLLGTIYERKGQLAFVEAAARVRQVIPDAHFVFAGYNPRRGTYLNEIYQQIDALDASDYVHYLGYRLDYVDIMKSLDVYVLASRQEQLPLVILEAMACGKPVVATQCGGTSEAVIDKETGLLVDIGNVGQLARALIDLLSRPDRGASLGMRGRERVVSLFDSRKCLRALPPIYQDVLDRASQNRGILRRLIMPRMISLFLRLCSSDLRGYDTVRWHLSKLRLRPPGRIKLD